MSAQRSAPATDVERARQLLEEVRDPEIPAISIVDLGIVRDVRAGDAPGSIEVDITPTWSGCPAMDVIERDTATVLQSQFDTVTVRTVLSPAWTTDWISERGRRKLRESGIAPPAPARARHTPATTLQTIAAPAPAAPVCPRCGSGDVERISEYGSTACKSLWRCTACGDPFDAFKPL